MKRHLRKIAVLVILLMTVTIIPADISRVIAADGMKAERISYDPAVDESADNNSAGVIDLSELPVVEPAPVTGDPDSTDISSYGYDPDVAEIDFSRAEAEAASDNTASAYQSKYDMRTTGYASRVKVKNQSETGLCWAFAATTAAEINWYHRYGANAAAREFSPIHLGYFTYNRVPDPLGLTVNDKNTVKNGKTWVNAGGNTTRTMNVLSGWGGFALESSFPFANRFTDSSKKYYKTYSTSDAYKNSVIVDDAYVINKKNRTEIKQAVIDNGSVVTGIHMDKKYLNGYAYYSNQSGTNHEVLIVGWDDNYSRNNFGTSANSSRPSSNGAWIIMNSWGEGFGDKGFCYVSYEEPTLSGMLSLTVQSPDKYSYNYHYDGSGSNSSNTIYKNMTVANLYTAKNDGKSGNYQTLETVGITTYSHGTCNFRIDIYTGCSANSPASGTKMLSWNVTTTKAGYNSFDLPYAIEVPDGKRFSILVTPYQSTSFAIDKNSSSANATCTSYISNGQSFYFNNVKYVDYATLSGCARIKGLVKENANRAYQGYRYNGASRYETAYMVANTMKEKYNGNKKYSTAIIASGEKFPDALSGSYLSKVYSNAPIVLVNNKSEASMIAWTKNSLKSGGKIFILGGEAVVSANLERNLRNAGYSVERLKGKDRYSTNIAILKRAGVSGKELVVCSGTGYADSLSASALGKPILLVGKGLTSEQINYMKSSGISKKSYIIGGTAAVNSTVQSQLSYYGISSSPERISGSNRYETSAKVAKKFFKTPVSVVLAWGGNFPDGLSGGPLALRLGGPMLLIDNNVKNTIYAKDYIHDANPSKLEVGVMGGEIRISDSIMKYVLK